MQANQKPKRNLWYVKRGKEIRGPFTAGVISRYILLGRIRETDEISPDKTSWKSYSDYPELIPPIMQDSMDDPIARQRLMASKRWEDERTREERRHISADVDQDKRSRADRRVQESSEEVRARARKNELTESNQEVKKGRRWVIFLSICVLAALIAIVYFYKPESQDDESECTALAAPGVNWHNCQMEGAELSGANLIGANLQNMNLSGADLTDAQLVNVNLSYSLLSVTKMRNADLRQSIMVGVSLRNADLVRVRLDGADLSYADLTGANLAGANLKDVKFDNAIWLDGKTKCAPGSVGECLLPGR